MLRKPAVAGMFYPKEKEALQKMLASFFQTVDQDISFQEKIKNIKTSDIHGLIVPHAGYIYSGRTAAYAYSVLKKAKPKKILLLGPNHTIPLSGISFAAYKSWETPLGKIDSVVETRITSPLIAYENNAHLKEHCLEVQLPFLQYLLQDFRIAPSVVGELTENEIKSFAKLLKEKFEDYFIVISTDLSHYLSQNNAEKEDQKTISSITNLNPVNLNACGRFPLAVAIELCKLNRWQPRLLYYSTSAEASGDASRVVGYASLFF